MKKLAILCVLVGILLIAFALVTSATNIPITNSTFDDPPQSPGGYTVTGINGWTINATASDARLGVWYPTVGQSSTEFVNGIPDKPQVGYTNGVDIAQTLNNTLGTGYKYNLEIYIGGHPDSLGSKPYAVILAGDDITPLGSIEKTSPLNAWSKQIIAFTCAIDDPRIGDNLTIKILNNDGGQRDFDKVSRMRLCCHLRRILAPI